MTVGPLLTLLAALALVVLPDASGVALAVAQAGRPDLATTIKVDKTGKEAAKPGQVLTYTITTTNQGDAVARDVAVINPVPPATVCIPKSARGRDTRILFSLDGGKAYGPWPIRLKDPKTGEAKDAAPDRITHVKWLLRRPLAPGRAAVVSYQVRVK